MITQRTPLISCVMLTADRPEFAAQAIESFFAQDWIAKELVIYDTGLKPCAYPRTPKVLYIRGGERGSSIGLLRNCANRHAAGALIAHWDDDDVSNPERLTQQANLLMEHDADVVGYRSLVFRTHTGHFLLYNGDPEMPLGTSLMYKRVTWEKRPFFDMHFGEDFHFCERRKLVSAAGHNPIMMVARQHGENATNSIPILVRDMWRSLTPSGCTAAERLLSSFVSVPL